MNKKVCLVDGSGYIFRAFYAIPPLTTSDGIPVNAVLGFSNMFMRLTQTINCDYCLVLFDAKRANYRNDIFADYKGTRKEIPEELIPQFPIIREAADALNIHHLEMEGYEADDLIATYAREAREKGYDVVVVSADKDLMQLIRDGVELFDPMKDKFFTPEDVKEKFGVYPDKVIDVQALAGDSIDNVPGVAGIGIKTAAQLINEFGSLQQVLDRAGEIKQQKRRQTLLDNRENALISLQLVTLKDDVPVENNIEAFACRCPEREKLTKFIDRYELNSIRTRANKWLDERCCTFGQQSEEDNRNIISAPKTIAKKYELVTNEKQLKAWVEKICNKGLFAFDTETTGLNPLQDKIVGMSIAVNAGEACYIPLNHISEHKADLFSDVSADMPQLTKEIVCQYLKPLFEAKSILKIGHNIKFDMHFMTQILGEESIIFPYDDTAVMSYVLHSSTHGHGMDELAEIYLNYNTIRYEEVCGNGKDKITFDKVTLDKALDYAAEDADITLRLYDIFKPQLVKNKMLDVYESFDRPLVAVLHNMEKSGIMVNAQSLSQLKNEFEHNIYHYEQEIYKLAGEEFNIGSPKQIGEILFVRQGLKGKKTASGAYQTGADVLEKLADDGNELAAKILDWRVFSKLKSTYTDALLDLLDKNNRIHTTYNQTVVNTGRLASNNPNLQNIPIRTDEGKKIRECFVAQKGYKLIASDYSQVELRLLAAVADVKGLKQAFATGIDVHAATASKVFGVPYEQVDSNLRRHAKAINFGIVYGISQYGLAKQIGVKPEEAKAYIDAYFAQMPEIKTYMDNTIAFAHRNGYVLTPFGRKCSISGINDNNKRIVANAERAAINAPIQGGAADIIKLAMIRMPKILQDAGLQTKMLLQVHDELVFEAPESEVEQAAKLIKQTMENVVNLSVPFIAEVGIGNNWTEAH